VTDIYLGIFGLILAFEGLCALVVWFLPEKCNQIDTTKVK